MTDGQRSVAQPIAADWKGHRTVGGVIEFVDIMPPLGPEAARIRFRVGVEGTLDLPLSENALVALCNSLLPRFAPKGWAKKSS